MKRLIIYLSVFFLFVPKVFGFNSIEAQKEQYKNTFINDIPKTDVLIGSADRIEADALLELASEKILVYQDYNTSIEKTLPKSKLLIMIMPRIDLLGLHIQNLAKTSEKILVFIMENDKLDGIYGDRSYETYIKKGIDKKIPKNVKVYKLYNESVTNVGYRNNYEFSNIFESKVYKSQIEKIVLDEITKYKKVIYE